MQRQFDFEARATRAEFAAGVDAVRVKAFRPVALQDQEQVVERSAAIKAKGTQQETRQQTGRKLRDRIEQIGWRCELSGAKLTPDTFSLDHIVPLAHGGSHDASNI